MLSQSVEFGFAHLVKINSLCISIFPRAEICLVMPESCRSLLVVNYKLQLVVNYMFLCFQQHR